MIAEPAQQPPGGFGGDLDVAGAVAAGVDLHRQQDAQVIQQGRHDRPDQHRQIGHLQVLGDDEGRGAQRRRGQDGADAGGGQHSSGVLGRVARPAQHRPGHRAQADRRRGPRAGDAAHQETGQRHRPARGRARFAERGEGQVDEELAGPRGVQHRAVDGEHHDVGGRDVQRHPVEAGGLDERGVDDLIPVHPGMRDRRTLRQIAAVVGVPQRPHAHDRQRRAGGAPTRLQHQQQHERPDDDVDRPRGALAAQKLVESASPVGDLEGQHRIQARHQRDRGQQPVERRRVLALRRWGGAPMQSRSGAVAQQRQRQHRRQEQDQRDLVALGQRKEHLIQREQPDQHAGGRHSLPHPTGQLAGRLLLLKGGSRGALGQEAAPSSSSAFLAPGCSGTGLVWVAVSSAIASAALLAFTRSSL